MEVPTGKIAWLLKPFTLHDLIIILLKKEHKIVPMAYLTMAYYLPGNIHFNIPPLQKVEMEYEAFLCGLAVVVT